MVFSVLPRQDHDSWHSSSFAFDYTVSDPEITKKILDKLRNHIDAATTILQLWRCVEEEKPLTQGIQEIVSKFGNCAFYLEKKDRIAQLQISVPTTNCVLLYPPLLGEGLELHTIYSQFLYLQSQLPKYHCCFAEKVDATHLAYIRAKLDVNLAIIKFFTRFLRLAGATVPNQITDLHKSVFARRLVCEMYSAFVNNRLASIKKQVEQYKDARLFYEKEDDLESKSEDELESKSTASKEESVCTITFCLEKTRLNIPFYNLGPSYTTPQKQVSAFFSNPSSPRPSLSCEQSKAVNNRDTCVYLALFDKRFIENIIKIISVDPSKKGVFLKKVIDYGEEKVSISQLLPENFAPDNFDFSSIANDKKIGLQRNKQYP